MIIRLIQYLLGYLRLEIEGASSERFFNMCAHHNIKLWNLDIDNERYRFYISRLHFKKLRTFNQKTNTKIHIIERHGMPFIIFKYRKKKILFLLFLFIFISALLSRNYIWNIEISGNQYYTNEHIISFLNVNEIQRFMNKNEINYDSIEALIREEFYYVIWTSVSLNGNNLVINIKENEQIVSDQSINESLETNAVVNEIEEYYGTDIIASISGTVSSIITRSGRALVHVGDVVEVGDILVTGCLEIMGDYDVLMGYTYVESDADILIETSYSYEERMNINYLKKVYLDNTQKKFYVKFSSYYLMLNQKNNLENYYDVSIIEHALAPDQQTKFLFSVGVITNNAYEFEDAIYSDVEIQEILSEKFQLYKEDLMKKGVEILENNVRIYIDKTFAIAKGDINVLVPNIERIDTEIKDLPEDVIQEGTDE